MERGCPMTDLKVIPFGPKNDFYSLATKMLRDTLKENKADWFLIATSLSTCSRNTGAKDREDEIMILGYQEYGCFKCGSRQLPSTVGMCQSCYWQKFPPASNTEDEKPEEKPTLKPLKYAAWRALRLPEHSGLVDLKTVTYYSRLLVTPGGFYTRRGLEVGESRRLRGYRDGYWDHTKPLPGFFIRNCTTGITNSYAQKDTAEVANVMELGAKKNLNALFQVRIEPGHEQEALEEIDRQLCFIDRVIQKGHLKGQVRAIFSNLERYRASRQGK